MNLRLSKKVSLFGFLIFLASVVVIYRNLISTFDSCVEPTDYQDNPCDDSIFFDFYNDVLVTISIVSVGLFACVSATEVTEAHVHRLRAGRHADSVLNHVLKNKVAGAAAVLEIFIQDNPSSKSRLQAACDQMYRSMSWCAVRQTMLDLVGGAYTTTLEHVHLQDFLEGMMPPSVPFQIKLPLKSKTESGESIESVDVFFDEKMARLALENVISNAVTHGDNAFPIQLGASFQHGVADCVGEGSLVFTMENQVPSGVILTDDILRKLRDGSVLDVLPKRIVGPPSDVTKVLIKDKKANSTSSGLKHATLALKGAGGTFDICMGSKRKSVVVRLVLPAKKLAKKNVEDDTSTAVSSLPKSGFEMAIPGLRVCCIDDSKVMKILTILSLSVDVLFVFL